MTVAFAALAIVAVLALLGAERRGSRAGKWLAKPPASAAVVAGGAGRGGGGPRLRAGPPVGRRGARRVAVAAVAFSGWDRGVARAGFVAPAFATRLWGLPLYYGAQLLFAFIAGQQ